MTKLNIKKEIKILKRQGEIFGKNNPPNTPELTGLPE